MSRVSVRVNLLRNAVEYTGHTSSVLLRDAVEYNGYVSLPPALGLLWNTMAIHSVEYYGHVSSFLGVAVEHNGHMLTLLLEASLLLVTTVEYNGHTFVITLRLHPSLCLFPEFP